MISLLLAALSIALLIVILKQKSEKDYMENKIEYLTSRCVQLENYSGVEILTKEIERLKKENAWKDVILECYAKDCFTIGKEQEDE